MNHESHLVYDSLRGRRDLGTRDLVRTPERKLLFWSEDICLEVLIQPGGGQLRILHGQLTENPSGRPLSEIEVAMGPDIIQTDDYGEFTMTVSDACEPRLLCVRDAALRTTFTIPAAEDE